MGASLFVVRSSGAVAVRVKDDGDFSAVCESFERPSGGGDLQADGCRFIVEELSGSVTVRVIDVCCPDRDVPARESP